MKIMHLKNSEEIHEAIFLCQKNRKYLLYGKKFMDEINWVDFSICKYFSDRLEKSTQFILLNILEHRKKNPIIIISNKSPSLIFIFEKIMDFLRVLPILYIMNQKRSRCTKYPVRLKIVEASTCCPFLFFELASRSKFGYKRFTHLSSLASYHFPSERWIYEFKGQ